MTKEKADRTVFDERLAFYIQQIKDVRHHWAIAFELAYCRAVMAEPSLPDIGMRDGEYKDSTPKLHVGNSSFEDWYQSHPKACTGNKQLARDAYAAGMGDPLVTYAQPS